MLMCLVTLDGWTDGRSAVPKMMMVVIGTRDHHHYDGGDKMINVARQVALKCAQTHIQLINDLSGHQTPTTNHHH